MLYALLALCILIWQLDLSVDIRRAFTDSGVQFRLWEPVKCIHVLVLFMLCEALEYPASLCIFDPFDLNCLKCATADYFVDPIQNRKGCAIFELLDNGPCLCKEPQEIQIIAFLHAQTICLLILFSLCQFKDLGPHGCQLRLFTLMWLLLRALRSSISTSEWLIVQGR